MRLFHKHKFDKELERFYAPPVGKELTEKVMNVLSEKLAREVSFGITTIHFVCECGEHRFEKVLGKRIRGRGKKEK